jgi:N-acetylglucosaminyl-diphospho-decaprenol L-rhamnosyltransferase
LLSIIIVAWNCKDEVIECLNSLALLAEIPVEFEVIVVDNASEDDTVKGLLSFRSTHMNMSLRIIMNSRNVGLSSATDQAYHQASGDWILLCNPDIVFNKDASILLAYGRSHQDELITVAMVSEDGTLQRVIHRRFPNVTRVFFEFGLVGSYLDAKFMDYRVRKSFCYQDVDFPPIATIESPGASFLLLNRSVFDKLGIIFDPLFPVWWNDVDLAKRAQAAGIPRILLSNVRIKHGLGKGSQKMSRTTRRYLFCRSMMRYARRWRMHPNLIRLLFFTDAIVSVFLFTIVQSRFRTLSQRLRGSVDYAAAQITGVLV